MPDGLDSLLAARYGLEKDAGLLQAGAGAFERLLGRAAGRAETTGVDLIRRQALKPSGRAGKALATATPPVRPNPAPPAPAPARPASGATPAPRPRPSAETGGASQAPWANPVNPPTTSNTRVPVQPDPKRRGLLGKAFNNVVVPGLTVAGVGSAMFAAGGGSGGMDVEASLKKASLARRAIKLALDGNDAIDLGAYGLLAAGPVAEIATHVPEKYKPLLLGADLAGLALLARHHIPGLAPETPASTPEAEDGLSTIGVP
jgi:hypothetical protein